VSYSACADLWDSENLGVVPLSAISQALLSCRELVEAADVSALLSKAERGVEASAGQLDRMALGHLLEAMAAEAGAASPLLH
jgi:hypothetical protein